MQYLTAMAIIEVTHATVGDYVIIRAASSSVGLAAIQLANWAGATPIAATRRSAKRQALLDHGAKHVIATEESDLVAEVMKITGGKGARIVFDPVGGPVCGNAGAGHGGRRDTLYLWRPERPADDAPALAGGLQESEHPRLGRLDDLELSRALRTREGADPARAGRRPT